MPVHDKGPLGAALGAAAVVTSLIASASVAAAASPSPRPRVSSVSQGMIPARGGAVIDVYGTGFRHVRKVLFRGVRGTHLKVLTSKHLRVTSPKVKPGQGYLRVVTPAGTSPRTATTHVAFVRHGVTGWKRTLRDPDQPSAFGPSSVSCVRSGFCAFSYPQGSVVTFNGDQTSPRQQVFPFGDPGEFEFEFPTDVSCSSAHFCVMVGFAKNSGRTVHPGQAAFWNGSSWAPRATPAGFDQVSCVSHSFCVAGANVHGCAKFSLCTSRYSIWNGHTWSTPRKIAMNEFADVSCVTTKFCVAVGGRRTAQWNGKHWKVTVRHGLPPSGNDHDFVYDELVSVSCSSVHFCLGAHSRGLVTSYSKGRWRRPVNLGWGTVQHVSCSNARLCVGAGFGGISVWNGRSWSKQNGPRAVNAVSCLHGGRCTLVALPHGDLTKKTNTYSYTRTFTV